MIRPQNAGMEKSTHSHLYDKFRVLLVEMRKKAGLNQRQLAEKLDRERSFVGRYEIGDRRIDLVEFYWICIALDQDPEEIFSKLVSKFRKAPRKNAIAGRHRIERSKTVKTPYAGGKRSRAPRNA